MPGKGLKCASLAEGREPMPLTPLPANNTKRYKMLYVVGGVNHSLTARCSSSQSDGTAVGYFNAAFAVLAAFLGSNVTWTELDVALQGSDIFNATGGWSPLTGTGISCSGINGPRAICFPGRTSGGRKTKAFLYGADNNYATPATFEEDPITTTALSDFQDLLVGQSDFWLGIDEIKPSWYERLTVKVNDHFVQELR